MASKRNCPFGQQDEPHPAVGSPLPPSHVQTNHASGMCAHRTATARQAAGLLACMLAEAQDGASMYCNTSSTCDWSTGLAVPFVHAFSMVALQEWMGRAAGVSRQGAAAQSPAVTDDPGRTSGPAARLLLHPSGNPKARSLSPVQHVAHA